MMNCFWNRTLTNAEITQLYNSGDGITYTDSFPPANIAPNSPTNISWETTGGFTDDTLKYNQIIDFINATCSDDDDDLSGCNITITNPSSTKVVDNSAMTNSSATDFSYATDFTLNEAGVWTINITAYDSNSEETSNSTTFNVSTVVQSLIDGIYAYDTQEIPSNSTIETLAGYDFDYIEIRGLASNQNTNWSVVKNAIASANSENIKVGLVYDLDYNLTVDSTSRDSFMENITLNFPDLLNSPYFETVEYIKILVNNTYTGDFSDTNFTDDNIDVIGKHISDTIGNEFTFYSSYNSSTLDTNYLHYDNRPRISETTNASLINELADLTKTRSSISRVYYNLTTDGKTVVQTYQNNILYLLTDSINSSSAISDNLVSELNNGDLIVYNNKSDTSNFTINVSNGIDISGKDIWDYTNGLLLESDSDGIITFRDIAQYSAILVGTEDLNHLQMSSDLFSSTAYKQTSTTTRNINYTDGIRDGASVTTTTRAVEIWDSNYVQPTTLIYYGWLNSSNVKNPYTFDDYKYLIIADENDAEIDKLFWSNISIDYVLGYISVGDYNSTNATWLSSKKTEVDTWLAFNESMNIFFDGIDSAFVINATAFEEDMSELTTYVKVTKNRHIGINVFTQYQSFAQMSDLFAMKESCTHKWLYANGVNSSDGYNYTNQYFEDYNGYGDYNKSIWYNNHNIDTLCVAFIDRDTTYVPKSANYSLMQKLYFKARVLGYENIVFSAPNFQTANFDRNYDVGTALQSQPTVNSDLYSMKYSKGIVYYNSTSDIAWFDDGLTFNNADININLHDNTAFDYDIFVNDVLVKEITTAGDGYSYDTHNFTINKSIFLNSYGHYFIEVNGSAGSFLGSDTDIVQFGKHSFYDNSGTWSIVADATGNYMINVGLDTTKKTAIDTTSKIIQTNETNSILKYSTVNISSDYEYNISIWSYPIYTEQPFANVSVWNGTEYVILTNVTNSTDCDSDNPSFATNTVNGITGNVGVCIDTSGTEVLARFDFPHLSEVSGKLASGNIAPTVTLNSPENGGTDYNLTTILNITPYDVNNDTMSVAFYNGTWSELSSSSGNENGTDVTYSWSALAYNTTYIWYVNVSDGIDTISETYNFTTKVDDTPVVIFNNSYPVDFDSTNLNSGGNITYTFTDAVGIENSSVSLFVKSNSSTRGVDYWRIENGSVIQDDYLELNDFSVDGNEYTFGLCPCYIYSGVSNIKIATIKEYDHFLYNLTNQNQYIKIKFFNMTNETESNVIRIMTNRTSGTNPSPMYYCNSSYSTGSPVTDNNCVQFDTIHTDHDPAYSFNNSYYHYSTGVINTTDGTYEGIKLTSISYFLIRGAVATTTSVGYVEEITRTDTIQITGNGGNTWTNFAGTVDASVDQVYADNIIYYYAFANNTMGLGTTSLVTVDAMEYGILPPTSPQIITPKTLIYSNTTGEMNISYRPAETPTGSIIQYNISLLNSTYGYISTIVANNSINLNYSWDFSAIADGTYAIEVWALTNNSLTSSAQSEIFEIDNTPPTVTSADPLITTNEDFTMTITTDSNSTCRISATPNNPYENMTENFTTTNALTHKYNFTGLTYAHYSYYVKCSDIYNNTMTSDYTLAFERTTPKTSGTSSPSFTIVTIDEEDEEEELLDEEEQTIIEKIINSEPIKKANEIIKEISSNKKKSITFSILIICVGLFVIFLLYAIDKNRGKSKPNYLDF